MMRRDPARPIVVVAAVVEQAGRFLVTRRPRAAHLGGYWEFPGGKREADESLEDALRREMREELDVGIAIGEQVHQSQHPCDGHVLELHFFRGVITGPPRPCLDQTIRWATRRELRALRFPPADAALIDILADVTARTANP